MAKLDATQILDREHETAEFAAMLACAHDARVMMLSDDSGKGKTELLRKLHLNCKVEHEVPVALIDFADYEDRPEEWPIVHDIAQQLISTGLELPAFTTLDNARALENADQFASRTSAVHSHIHAPNAQVSGDIIGVRYDNSVVNNFQTTSWSEEAERLAREECMNALLEELAATESPAVVILDSVEKADRRLRDWFIEKLIVRTVVANAEKAKLFGVIAGVGLAPLVEGRLPHRDKNRLLASSLQAWSQDLIEPFLRAHDFDIRNGGIVKVVTSAFNEGYTLQHLVGFAAVAEGLADG